jgi:TetR/AcrR family transcriptional regulator, cholesterol catabolism regulator
LVIGALNWCAEWFDPPSSVDTVVSNAQVLVRNGLSAAPLASRPTKRTRKTAAGH